MRTTQPAMFGGPAGDAQVVRPVVPSPELLQVAKRPPKGAGVKAPCPIVPVLAAGVAVSPRIAEPDKLSRSGIAALVKRRLSAGRDVYVMAANNAEGCAPLTLQELAKAVAAYPN
jgi:hypothetical protein